MEDLEGRFWYNGEKPYLWILAAQMPNASADDFYIVHVERDSSFDEIIHTLNTNPVDAVYLDAAASGNYDSGLLRALIAVGAVIYMKDRPEGVKCWPVKKFGQRIYTIGGVNKDPSWELTKRILDIQIGILGAAAAGAVYPFVAPIIRSQSGGSPLFVQNRIGYNGRPFKNDGEDSPLLVWERNHRNMHRQ